ncbi:NDP-sugar synthase [Candidatus Pacearchaeota archaeon]|nr:hypothetical protein [uncultured archaeon]MBS3078837.1 NDP-sugar synthase [Candidatus Pacearchaeota archaeon]
MKTKISITINEKILRDIDSVVDNIFIRNRSQAIEHFIKKALKESRIAVILAGSKSKGLVGSKFPNRYAYKIDNQTLIEKQIKKLGDSGFRTVYIIADHKTLTNIFRIIGDNSDSRMKIEYLDEDDQGGTASALKLLKGKIKTTFLVIQCDLVIDKVNVLELWNQHLESKMITTILICSSVIPSNDCLFGHVTMEGKKILTFDEKPVKKNLPSSLFFGGLFVAEPEIFNYPGRSLEFEIFPELTKRRLLGGYISGQEHLHIHTHEDLLNVRKKLKELEK